MSMQTPIQEDVFAEKNQVNFKMLLNKMLRNWYWFIISLVVCLILSFLYLRYATPVFKTSAKVLITSDEGQTSGEDAMAKALSAQFSTSSSIEGEAEIFKTRHLMEKVVRDLKSYITYYHKGKVKRIELYKSAPFKLTILGSPDTISPVKLDLKFIGNKIKVSSEKWEKTVDYYQAFVIPQLGKVQIEKCIDGGFIREDKDDEELFQVDVTTIEYAVTSLTKKLEVTIPVKQVDMIFLDYTNPVPEYAKDILNKLIEAYVQGNLLDKNKIADSTIAFIDERLLYVTKELGSVEGNVQAFKQRNKLADLSAQSTLLVNSTGDYVEQQAKLETQLSVVNEIQNYLNSTGNNQRLVPSGALLEDPSFAALVERYNTIVLEKEKRSIGQTDDNPYMQNLNNQIALAKADMLTSLNGLKKTLEIAKSKIVSRSNTLAGQVNKVPAVERTYLDLSRQQQIKQELYVFLLQKREETAISKTSNISNCKTIEPPITFGPISPVTSNIYGYGIILGLFIPFGIIFLADRMNDKVSTKEDVKNHTQASIIGEIGQNIDNDETIVVEQGSRTPISEQFRALRTNLAFFLNENEKTILLTSSMSGEGKSFVAINLATVLAISGKKVVMMEMDLRKPNLSNKLNMKNDFGFTNYIVTQELQPSDIVKPSGIQENLFLISSGNIPPNPTEIILNKRLDLLMAELKEKFDYIIIDAPPIGMVTDAQLLSKYANLTIYVIRHGYTFKDQLEIPQELYVTQKMNKIAVLMNDVKQQSGYGYGYGYGYGIEPDNKGWFSRIFKK